VKHTSLDKVFYVKVDNKHLGPQMPEGETSAILHGVYGRPGQHLLTHLLLETGGHWSGIPLIALGVERPPIPDARRQPWGCMGETPEVSHLPYLEGLKARCYLGEARHTGVMVDWTGPFSHHPQEHKPLSLLIDSAGGFLLMPNNYFTLEDAHFTKGPPPKTYRRGETTWWEGDSPIPQTSPVHTRDSL
jgi:hypothetical protein